MQIDKSVVIVREKESVVVRGIVKKFQELDYNVFKATTEDYDVKRNLQHSRFFIIFLPPDILEDRKELEKLAEYTSTISGNGLSMIVIGERKDQEDIYKAAPAIAYAPFLPRPLDIEKLVNMVEEMHEREMDVLSSMVPGDVGGEVDFGPEITIDSLGLFDPEPVAVKKRILIVDDDPSYASMVKEWLRGDYKIDIVTAGMHAITFLMKNKVDLIFLDYEMPVVDGPQVLQMLRSEPETSDIPVIFLTGIGTKESVSRVLALKPAGYILKSTTRGDLLDYVNRFFQR